MPLFGFLRRLFGTSRSMSADEAKRFLDELDPPSAVIVARHPESEADARWVRGLAKRLGVRAKVVEAKEKKTTTSRHL